MWTHEIKIVKKNHRPRSISGGGASLLKFSSKNSIGENMGTCMPEGIKNFDQWNQRWGMIY